MRGWWRRLVADFKAEYARRLAEHEPRDVVVSTPSSPQPIQTAVDMIVWRARGCGLNGLTGGHDEFDATCPACWDFTHCTEHDEFDAECEGCRTMKNPEVLGTVSHYHVDPGKRAAESELGQGEVIWRT